MEVNGPKDAEFGARRFIEAIRKYENYRHAYIVGMVENQGDHNYPQFWHDWWKEYPPYISAMNMTHPLHLPGVPTGEKEKDRYDDCLNRLLAVGAIAFERRFITGFSHTAREHEHTSHVKGVLRSQLRDYCIISKKSEQKGITVVTKTRTGKHSGGKDDLAMALQIALYHSKRAMSEDQPVRNLGSNGYPFHWSIDESLDARNHHREIESRIPVSVRLAMPAPEQASQAEKRRDTKRQRVAALTRAADAAVAGEADGRHDGVGNNAGREQQMMEGATDRLNQSATNSSMPSAAAAAAAAAAPTGTKTSTKPGGQSSWCRLPDLEGDF